MNTNGPTILGLPTCRDMKLVTLNCSLTTTSVDAKKDLLCQYKDCFEGIGCFRGEFHITLDGNLRAVMERARETGIRFNLEKCRIRCTEVPFFGNIVSDGGLKPDLQKINAINNMDPSQSLADLQTFLGMVQFLSRFVPNLASLSACLTPDQEREWVPVGFRTPPGSWQGQACSQICQFTQILQWHKASHHPSRPLHTWPQCNTPAGPRSYWVQK